MEYNTDYYKVLRVPKYASLEEIKKAFRRLAVKYHPDTHTRDKFAEEMYSQASEAYNVLSKPERRTDYDAWHKSVFPESLDSEKNKKHRETEDAQEDRKEGLDFKIIIETEKEHKSLNPKLL